MNNKINHFLKLLGTCSSIILLGLTLGAQSANAEICWKDSYGRGVGTIPNACPAGFSATGFGTCSKDCPAGFRNDGLFCAKPAAYGRGAGYPWKFGDAAFNLDPARSRCKNENPQGCEKDGAIIYPVCKPGYTKVGCCVCSPICPAGMTDIGVSCTKPTVVATCPAGKINDAGLCYNPCAGMKGVGPVCWGGCPAGMIDCGAMCGSSIAECTSSITNMVVSVGSLAAKVASIVGTAGAAVGVTAATEAAKQAAINTLKETAKTVAKNLLKQFAGVAKEQLLPRIAAELRTLPDMPEFLVEKLAKLAIEPDTFDVANFVKGLDPTGIGKVVDAFNKKICGK
jgi:hypothetical protein